MSDGNSSTLGSYVNQATGLAQRAMGAVTGDSSTHVSHLIRSPISNYDLPETKPNTNQPTSRPRVKPTSSKASSSMTTPTPPPN